MLSEIKSSLFTRWSNAGALGEYSAAFSHLPADQWYGKFPGTLKRKGASGGGGGGGGEELVPFTALVTGSSDGNLIIVEDSETVCLSQTDVTFSAYVVKPDGTREAAACDWKLLDDGTNDVFMVYGDEDEIVSIRSFLVFSRWGEAVHEFYNIPPNQPAYGWDGSYRGQVMDPAVFTWFAEVEFVDGRVELFEGDVNLVK